MARTDLINEGAGQNIVNDYTQPRSKSPRREKPVLCARHRPYVEGIIKQDRILYFLLFFKKPSIFFLLLNNFSLYFPFREKQETTEKLLQEPAVWTSMACSSLTTSS